MESLYDTDQVCIMQTNVCIIQTFVCIIQTFVFYTYQKKKLT